MGDKKGKVDEALLAEIAALGDAAERHQALIDRMDEEIGQLIEMVCEPIGGKLPPAVISASPSVGKDGKPVGHATMPDGYRPLDFSDSSSRFGLWDHRCCHRCSLRFAAPRLSPHLHFAFDSGR